MFVVIPLWYIWHESSHFTATDKSDADLCASLLSVSESILKISKMQTEFTVLLFISLIWFNLILISCSVTARCEQWNVSTLQSRQDKGLCAGMLDKYVMWLLNCAFPLSPHPEISSSFPLATISSIRLSIYPISLFLTCWNLSLISLYLVWFSFFFFLPTLSVFIAPKENLYSFNCYLQFCLLSFHQGQKDICTSVKVSLAFV